ncbi:MAG: hypothetical protein WC682_05280 [Parcubacteria group bacterium]|jgi:hypothetical protein
MNYKKEILILLGVGILMFIIGIGIVYPEMVGLCNINDNACIYKFPVFSLGEPLLLGAPFLIVVSIILFFLRHDFYNVWKKFAKIFLPIAIILILITPTQYGGFVGIDKEMATWGLASLFLISSLGIIIWKSIQLRKK